MQPPGGQAILDAEAIVIATPTDSASAPLSVQAVRGAGGNLLLYHAALELPRPGRWRVGVTARSPVGVATTGFEITVEPASPVPTLLVGAAALGLIVWLLWRLRRRSAV